MKTTKALFFELMDDFQSERWNEFELVKLSLRELLALAKLLGCPSWVAKKWSFIVRLLAQRELRLKLSRFTDNPEELANSYKRESLRRYVTQRQRFISAAVKPWSQWLRPGAGRSENLPS